jgi:hypothetical protein
MRRLSLALAAALALGGCSHEEKAASAAPPAAPAGDVQPEALVKKMSDTLAAAQTFSFSTTEVHEQRAASGKREMKFSRTQIVERPNHLAFTITGSARAGGGAYDGAHFMLVWTTDKAYARVKAPGTLDAMLDEMAERFKMPMPVGDLIYSNPYDRFIGPDTKGKYVGRETVGGKECEHLAYSEALVDWEIWIAAAGDALPCQLWITSKGKSGPLTSKVAFSDWNLAAKAPEGAFKTEPPADFERILMVQNEPDQAQAAASATPAAQEKK